MSPHSDDRSQDKDAKGKTMVRIIAAAVVLSVLVGAGIATLLGFPQVSRPKQSVPFAADRLPGTKPAPAAAFKFDGDKAMEHLRTICAIGPRISGSQGILKQQELLKDHFEKLGARVELQKFTAKQVSRKDPVDMVNLIASFNPEAKKRVIICSHYDTRPIADQEMDPRKWREPFISANDGGSGVAFLMEFGRHVKDIKTNVGIDFVFFDGEEYIFESNRDKYFFGSEHFAKTWKLSKPRIDYQAAILLDMIAGKNARFPVEGHSWGRHRELCIELWTIAQQLNCTSFENELGSHVLDDHIALQKAGIPAIDIIDFSYTHWHRLTDTPENCSGEAMEQVAAVLNVWLQKRKE